MINLQHPGEHASCGFGLEDSGFSYEPQHLMDEDGMIFKSSISIALQSVFVKCIEKYFARLDHFNYN